MTKNADLTAQSFDELVASKLTFDEIAAQYDEETAINVGIARTRTIRDGPPKTDRGCGRKWTPGRCATSCFTPTARKRS